MKLSVLRKTMAKVVFSIHEVQNIAWQTGPKTLLLQLHQWVRAGELMRLKRGLYAFPDRLSNLGEVAKNLHTPAYISLESALHYHGLLPDNVFALTLVGTKATRSFHTPVGDFIYHHIKTELFFGFDPATLMAEREKAIVDYCYIYYQRMEAKKQFWDALRWQNLGDVNFKKIRLYSRGVKNNRVIRLLESLATYGTT